MRCFRWRIADNCGEDRSLKCSMRHRANLDDTLITDGSAYHLRSPGFDKRGNRSRYYNRNFCIYNVSLDCPDEMVELVPTSSTTKLSDTHPEPCQYQDYLTFHIDSKRKPLIELCGAAVTDRRNYHTIPSSSFHAVLWTNDNSADLGQFEIIAQCKAPVKSQDSESDQGLLLLDQGSGSPN